MMAETIIQTRELTKRFGSLTAVDKLSISVEKGEVFGLLGPNGAGKTTIIRMLTTLLPPTGGTASVVGCDVVRRPSDVRRMIGYVPQILSADGMLTGYENLLIFAKLYDIPTRHRAARIRESLALMGLADVADKMVREYSGGMIRRLEIAQSTLHHPRVLFLDEPTIGLDPLARRAVWSLVGRLREDYGTTIILTTHFMEEADNLCSRVAIMHHGVAVAIGATEQLKASIDNDNASLEDVFIHYTGGTLETGGGYRETSRTRRAARRLG